MQSQACQQHDVEQVPAYQNASGPSILKANAPSVSNTNIAAEEALTLAHSMLRLLCRVHVIPHDIM